MRGMRTTLAVIVLRFFCFNCLAEIQVDIAENQKNEIAQVIRKRLGKSKVEYINVSFKRNVDVSFSGGPSSPRKIQDPRCPSGFFEKAFCIEINAITQKEFMGKEVPINDWYLIYFEPSGKLAYEQLRYHGKGYHNCSMGIRDVEGWLKEIYNLLPNEFKTSLEPSNAAQN